MPNRPAAPLVIDETEREALLALVRARTTEQRTAMRARVVLAAADGKANERIAEDLGVQRIWAEAGLRPHRVETFKFSRDPELEAKVRDVVGLYLAPPGRAVVLSLDEKT